jgi:hypothetical protein
MLSYASSYYNTTFRPTTSYTEYTSGNEYVLILRSKGGEAPTKIHQTVTALFKHWAATSRDVW